MLKCARFVAVKYFVTIAVGGAAGRSLPAAAQQPPKSPDVYGQIKYRYIGPEGNRATSVAGVPGNQTLVCWRGIRRHFQEHGWRDPLGSDFRLGVGGVHRLLAVAASDPNIVWAGTGEIFHSQPHSPWDKGFTNPWMPADLVV